MNCFLPATCLSDEHLNCRHELELPLDRWLQVAFWFDPNIIWNFGGCRWCQVTLTNLCDLCGLCIDYYKLRYLRLTMGSDLIPVDDRTVGDEREWAKQLFSLTYQLLKILGAYPISFLTFFLSIVIWKRSPSYPKTNHDRGSLFNKLVRWSTHCGILGEMLPASYGMKVRPGTYCIHGYICLGSVEIEWQDLAGRLVVGNGRMQQQQQTCESESRGGGRF